MVHVFRLETERQSYTNRRARGSCSKWKPRRRNDVRAASHTTTSNLTAELKKKQKTKTQERKIGTPGRDERSCDSTFFELHLVDCSCRVSLCTDSSLTANNGSRDSKAPKPPSSEIGRCSLRAPHSITIVILNTSYTGCTMLNLDVLSTPTLLYSSHSHSRPKCRNSGLLGESFIAGPKSAESGNTLSSR